MSRKTLPEGTVVTCPECKDEICVLKFPLCEGDPVSTGNMELLQDGHEEGTKMRCTRCHAYFGKLMLHTKDGWQ